MYVVQLVQWSGDFIREKMLSKFNAAIMIGLLLKFVISLNTLHYEQPNREYTAYRSIILYSRSIQFVFRFKTYQSGQVRVESSRDPEAET